jgi:diguanylate cyclase (GGDEF)-like protein
MTDERALWEDASILPGHPGFWRSADAVSEEEAREALINAVGLPEPVVSRMTGEQACDSLERFRSLVRRLTAYGETDELTGAIVRGAGLASLEREIARIGRTNGRLVVAFIDVDGLKSVNDNHGHLAGDQLLKEVVTALRAQLRSYDLVIRYAGDEFVCALLDTDLNDVTSRFGEVESLLASRTGGGSMSVGLTEFLAGDSVEDLIGRADAAMYARRRNRGR